MPEIINLEEIRNTVNEMEKLRKNIIKTKLTDMNAQALRSQMLQTVNSALINFKTLLSISEMMVSKVREEYKDE